MCRTYLRVLALASVLALAVTQEEPAAIVDAQQPAEDNSADSADVEAVLADPAAATLEPGEALLFVFAFGLSTLLIAVGTFSGLLATIPASGNWMNRVKIGIALLMLGAGEYFLIQMGMLLF